MDPRLRLDISWLDLVSGLAPATADARASIAVHWLGREAVTFLSVRTAFDALLQALNVTPGDEVVMSAVNKHCALRGGSGAERHAGVC